MTIKSIPGVGTPKFKHDQGEKETFLGHFEGHDLYYSPDDYGTVFARYDDHPYNRASAIGFQSGDDFAMMAKISRKTENPHMRAVWVAQMIVRGMKLKPDE